MSNFIILNNQVVEGLEVCSIFDSEKYDIFKGVTFSIDQKFAEKYLSNFKETTVVVGIQDSDVQERGLSLEQKQIKQLVDNTKVLSSGLPIKMFEIFLDPFKIAFWRIVINSVSHYQKQFTQRCIC